MTSRWSTVDDVVRYDAVLADVTDNAKTFTMVANTSGWFINRIGSVVFCTLGLEWTDKGTVVTGTNSMEVPFPTDFEFPSVSVFCTQVSSFATTTGIKYTDSLPVITFGPDSVVFGKPSTTGGAATDMVANDFATSGLVIIGVIWFT